MRRLAKPLFIALTALVLCAGTAHADEEAANQPRVFTDDWGACYAKSVPEDYMSDKGETRVYRVEKGDDKLQATFDWYAMKIEMICNACDGKGTCGAVLVRRGRWARGHEPNDKDIALEFYLGDKLQKRYSTLDIAGDKKNASMSVSHYTVIREYKGFVYTQSGAPRYVVVTKDGRELTFNAVTGELITLAENTKADLELINAVRVRNKPAVEAALKAGADINTAVADEYDPNYSMTPVHFAAQLNDHDFFKFLLSKGANINARTHRGETALSRALQNGNIKELEFLLDNGADPNTKGPYFGETMLHAAASSYNGFEAAKVLKAHGADIEGVNDYGRTPLHSAAHSYQGSDTLKWLLKNGANIEAISNFGETPLHLAARYGTADEVKILLDAGAKTDVRDNDKKSPLDYAKARSDNQPGIVKLLENARKK